MNGSMCSNQSLKAIVLLFSHTRPGGYLLSRPESVCNQFLFAVGTQDSSEISALSLPGCYEASWLPTFEDILAVPSSGRCLTSEDGSARLFRNVAA